MDWKAISTLSDDGSLYRTSVFEAALAAARDLAKSSNAEVRVWREGSQWAVEVPRDPFRKSDEENARDLQEDFKMEAWHNREHAETYEFMTGFAHDDPACD